MEKNWLGRETVWIRKTKLVENGQVKETSQKKEAIPLFILGGHFPKGREMCGHL